jgi:BA14K-like protein
MILARSVAAAVSIAAASVVFSPPVQAGGGHGDAAVAGVAGFALGTLFGTAAARPRYYPGTVYVAPAPVYIAPAPPPPVVYEPAPVVYVPAPWTPEWYSYCARRYRSFDANSGTFIGPDGRPHTCY